MGRINDIFDETDELLDDLVSSSEKRIAKAIKKLENQILEILPNLKTSAGASDKFKFKRAQEVHKQLVNLLESEYGTLTDALSLDLSDVDKVAIAELDSLGISAAFTTVDKEMFGVLKTSVVEQFKMYSGTAQQELAQALYDYAAGATGFSDVVNSFKNVLTGIETMPGKSLVQYSQGFAHDSVMEYFAAIQQKKGRAAGLNDFIYYGDIIGSSRPFCIARVGRVFTKNQIESWNNFVWKGKKRGSIWINRGGYNCRHHFRAIEKEWIKEGELEVGSFFDENPKAYTPELRKEVGAEIKKL